MSLAYIRETYKVPAKRGGRVEYMASDGALMEGTIKGAQSGRLRILLDGGKRPMSFHPIWNLKYIP